MAQPTNTFDTYDQTGIREDLTDVIHNIDPTDTPFYSSCAKTTASNRLHEWQTDSLRASAANAHIEGDDTVSDARSATVRLGNYTQIFKNGVTISGSDTGMKKAGRGDEMGYQIMKTAKEQKLDIEKALFANQARNAGSGSTARLLAGAPAWLFTNTNFQSGSSGADPTGDGTDARTDDGTPTAFSSTKFDNTMQSIWENSNASSNFTCYLSAYQMNIVLGFTGNNNQRATIPASQNKVINVVDVYATPWGTVDFVMSRECRGRDVFIMNSSYWKVPVLRGTRNEALAKTGDNEKRQIVTELTLECCNEAASGGIFDNSTS